MSSQFVTAVEQYSPERKEKENGVFLLLDSYLERKNYGTYMEEYTVPTLGVIMCPKDSKSSIVCLKFSYDGSFIAISYNNEYRM